MATRLIFAGAEVGSNRLLLTGMGVTKIAASYWRMIKRGLPNTKKYLFSEKIPEGVEVYMYPGTITDESVSIHDFENDYLQFVEDNLDSLGGVVEVVMPTAQEQKIHREKLIDLVGEDKAWIIWNPEVGAIDSFAQLYEHVVIHGDTLSIDPSIPGRLRALQGLYGTHWHALAFAQTEDIKMYPLDSVITHAWLAPMLRGETVHWDRNKLSRAPASMKDKVRATLGSVTQRAGLDIDKIQNDDAVETAKLAVWSYLEWESTLLRADQSEYMDDPGDAETGGDGVDHRALEVRNAAQVIPRAPEEKMILPGVGFKLATTVETDKDGNDTIRDVPVIESSSASLRQCNTCVVSASCPAFKQGSGCAFELPVRIQTKDQLKALLQVLIEIQGTRVLFGRFTEELNGGYPDENVSKEMDRLFKMVKTTKEIEEEREYVRMTVESNKPAGGALSRIFGERANVLRELPGGGLTPEQTDIVIEQGPESLK